MSSRPARRTWRGFTDVMLEARRAARWLLPRIRAGSCSNFSDSTDVAPLVTAASSAGAAVEEDAERQTSRTVFPSPSEGGPASERRLHPAHVKSIWHGGTLRRGASASSVLLGRVGVFMPCQSGAAWVTSPAIWGWVPLMLVAGAIAELVPAGERERHTLENAARPASLPTGANPPWQGARGRELRLGPRDGSAGVEPDHREPQRGNTRVACSHSASRLGRPCWRCLRAGFAATAGVLVSLRAASVRQAAQTLAILLLVDNSPCAGPGVARGPEGTAWCVVDERGRRRYPVAWRSRCCSSTRVCWPPRCGDSHVCGTSTRHPPACRSPMAAGSR